MPAKVVRIASHVLGWNTMLSDGFALGSLPGGGYGIRWRRSPGGHGETKYWSPWEPGDLGATEYWFPWEPPHDPVRIDFEGQEYVFCLETAPEEEVERARRVTYQQMREGR
jgi:hypothetical protein